MSDSYDGQEYQPVQAKFCASLLWFVCKVSENGNTADIPAEITSPFVITVTDALVVRPAVADYLSSGKMYLAFGNILFKHEVDTLWDLIQMMSNRGVFVMDEKEEAVTDLDLMEKFPFNMHSHLALMDAIMLMYVDAMVTVQDVVSVVRRFSTFNASKELPFDLEDAFLLWLNKINQSNIINHAKHIPQTTNEKIRLKKNQLVEKNVFPMVNELMDCPNDCKAFLSIVLYYMPHLLNFNGIKMSSLLSQEDKIYNIELFRSLCAEHICTSVFALRVEDFFYAGEDLKTNVLTLLCEVFYELELSKTSMQRTSVNYQQSDRTGVNNNHVHIEENNQPKQDNLRGSANNDPVVSENSRSKLKNRQHQPLLSKRSRKQFAKFEAELSDDIVKPSAFGKYERNVTHAWTPDTQLNEDSKTKLKSKISLEFRPDGTSNLFSTHSPDSSSFHNKPETGSMPHPHRSWTANAIYPTLPSAGQTNQNYHTTVDLSYPPSNRNMYQPIHTFNYPQQHSYPSQSYSIPPPVSTLNYSDGVQVVENVKSTNEEVQMTSMFHSNSLVGQLPSYNTDGSVNSDDDVYTTPVGFSHATLVSNQDLKDLDEDALSTITEGTEPDAPSLYSFHSSSSAASTKCNSEEEHEHNVNPGFLIDDFHAGVAHSNAVVDDERKRGSMSDETTDGNRTLVEGEGMQSTDNKGNAVRTSQHDTSASFANENDNSHVRGSYTVNRGTLESALATGLPIITNSIKRSFDEKLHDDRSPKYFDSTHEGNLSPHFTSQESPVIPEVPNLMPAQDITPRATSNRGEFEDAPLPVPPASARSRSSSSGISVDYGRWHFSPDNDESTRPSHVIYSSMSEQTDGSPVLINGNENVIIPVSSQPVGVTRNSIDELDIGENNAIHTTPEIRTEAKEAKGNQTIDQEVIQSDGTLLIDDGEVTHFDETKCKANDSVADNIPENNTRGNNNGNQTIHSNEMLFQNGDSAVFNNRPSHLNVPLKEDDKPLLRDVLNRVKLFNTGGISPSYDHWPFRKVDNEAVVILKQPVSPGKVTWLDISPCKSKHSRVEAERKLKEMQDKRKDACKLIHWIDLKEQKHFDKKVEDGVVNEQLTERLTVLRMKLEEKRQRFEEEKKRQQALWNQERAKILQDAFFVMITDNENKQPLVPSNDDVIGVPPSCNQSATWEVHFEKNEQPLEDKGANEEKKKLSKLSPREYLRQKQEQKMDGGQSCTPKQGLWFVGLSDAESDKYEETGGGNSQNNSRLERKQQSADDVRQPIKNEKLTSDQLAPSHQTLENMEIDTMNIEKESTLQSGNEVPELGTVLETNLRQDNCSVNEQTHHPTNSAVLITTDEPAAHVIATDLNVIATDLNGSATDLNGSVTDLNGSVTDLNVIVTDPIVSVPSEIYSQTGKSVPDEHENKSSENESSKTTQQPVEVNDTPIYDDNHGHTNPSMLSSTVPETDQVVLKPPVNSSSTPWSHQPEIGEDPVLFHSSSQNDTETHISHVINGIQVTAHDQEQQHVNDDSSVLVSMNGTATTSLEQRLEDFTISDVNSSDQTYMTSTPMKLAVPHEHREQQQSAEKSDASQSETSATTPQGTSWGFTFGDEFLESSGMTPKQERQKARFLKNRTKKLEEGKQRKEAELEKKRKKEEKLAEQRAKEEEEEKLRCERLIEQQLKDVTSQLHQETFTKRIHELTYNVDLKPTPEKLEQPRYVSRKAPTPSPLIRRVKSPDMSEEAGSNHFAEYKGPAAYQKPSGKSNRKIMQNAITHCCLCGEVNKDAKQKCLQAISQSDASHFLVLFREGLKFRSVYEYRPENETVTRIYGIGPKNITPKMQSCFFKYNSGGKEFNSLETKHLSIQVDGLMIKKELWEKKAGQTSKGNSNTKKKQTSGNVRPQSTR